ncbi:hypothetical protein ACHAXT_005317 [Thalassiosira profunda]
MASSSLDDAAPANVRVLVRVRPLNEREAKFSPDSALALENDGAKPTIDFGMNGKESKPPSSSRGSQGSQGTVSIADGQGGTAGGYGSGYESSGGGGGAPAKSYTYDAVFGPDSTQEDVFDSVKGIIDAVCAGYNGTIVAYGQTGSGKTHTIFGDEGLNDNDADAGLVQRSLRSIFRKISEQSDGLLSPTTAGAAAGGTIRTTAKASFLEIYNERVFDLLADTSAEDERGLPVREDALTGVYVEGLVEQEVKNTDDAMDVLRRGMDHRSTAATNMNRVSSRSHAVFTLTVKSELFSEGGISKVRTSKFALVDLAGSERQKATAADGDRLKEATMINSSLLCLGQVINSLVDREKGKRQQHVPFRNSKLTFLLRDSFGGNSKTCLVATVTPSLASLSETTSTLEFAQRAKRIKNQAVLNENTCGSVAALQAEIARLRAQLEAKDGTCGGGSGDGAPATGATVSALRNQNAKLNTKVKALTEATDHRETQVTTLKRKLQQETLIRQCKERRITYLAGKSKSSGMEDGDEVAALQAEVAALREQLEGQPPEAVEWHLKYKEERARNDELAADASTRLEADEKNELESTLVDLLDERESLQQQVATMSNQRNTEIDSIIQDVSKLEGANLALQSQLDAKEAERAAVEEKLQGHDSQLGELQAEMKTTLDCLEATQGELTAEKAKTVQLQASVDGMTVELSDANAAAAEHQGKLANAEEELKKLTDEHNEASAELEGKVAELQKDVDAAMDDNDSLMQKLKDASDDLEAKKTQLESLEQEKSEALTQLAAAQETGSADVESFRLKEEELKAEIAKSEETVATLLAEKTAAEESLEQITAQNASLSAEVEALKADQAGLQQRVEILDKLRNQVASLEDEVECMGIDKEGVEAKLAFVEADLERTIRLHEHVSATQTAAHDNDMAACDETIRNLSKEKADVQEELSKVSQQLAESTASSDGRVGQLQSEVDRLQERANTLEVTLKETEDAAETLRNEKAQADQQLLELSEQAESLKSDRDALQLELEGKVSELQKKLDDATEENESLAGKLKEATDDLDAKKAELDGLAREKADALNQLSLAQETGSADIESFKLKEEELKAEIAQSEEKVESLLAEKAETAKALETAAAESAALSEEVEALKSERDEMQKRAESLEVQVGEANSNAEASADELKKTIGEQESTMADLQAEVDAAKEENESLAEKLKETTDDLEAKKVALEELALEMDDAHKQLALAQETGSADVESYRRKEEELKAEISKGEEAVASLVAEKTEAASSLEEITAQNATLSAAAASLTAERDELQQQMGSLKDQMSTLEDDLEQTGIEKEQTAAKLKFAEADLERTIRLHEESSSAQAASHDADLATRDDTIGKLTGEKAGLQLELKRKEDAEREQAEQLAAKDTKLSEMEALVEQLRGEAGELNEKNASLAAAAEASEEEAASLKTKVEALEKENADLRDQSDANAKAPAEPEAPSPWAASPFQPGEEAPQNNSTFDADDTFDEEMFLPNVDEEANPIAEEHLPAVNEEGAKPTAGENKSPLKEEHSNDGAKPPVVNEDAKSPATPVDENKTPPKDAEELTPSKTPFQERRALFSPPPTVDEPVSKKKSTRAKRTKKADPKTPAPRRTTRRTTRSMRSASGAKPLGTSAANAS